jgi:hypothetical protein
MKPSLMKLITLRILAGIGLIVAFLVPIIIVFELSRPQQSIYAAVCGVVCLITYYFGNIVRSNIREKIDRDEKILKNLIWCGMGELGVLIFFVASTNFEIQIVRWGVMANFALSLVGYSSAFYILFTLWFPQVIVETNPITPPDPLAFLPTTLREVLHEGRTSVDITAIRVLAVYFLVVIVANAFLVGLTNLLMIIIVEFCAALPLAMIVRNLVARKWQVKARQLGIPEEELRSAAKLVGLPWPKIKEE